jgi:hypothetical protein
MKRNNLYINLISLRVKVSIFVLSPEIEDRGQVEFNNWAKLKKIFYSTGVAEMHGKSLTTSY